MLSSILVKKIMKLGRTGECPFRSFYVGAAISRPLLEKPELLEQRADNIRPYMASSRIDKMRIRTLPQNRISLPFPAKDGTIICIAMVGAAFGRLRARTARPYTHELRR